MYTHTHVLSVRTQCRAPHPPPRHPTALNALSPQPRIQSAFNAAHHPGPWCSPEGSLVRQRIHSPGCRGVQGEHAGMWERVRECVSAYVRGCMYLYMCANIGSRNFGCRVPPGNQAHRHRWHLAPPVRHPLTSEQRRRRSLRYWLCRFFFLVVPICFFWLCRFFFWLCRFLAITIHYPNHWISFSVSTSGTDTYVATHADTRIHACVQKHRWKCSENFLLAHSHPLSSMTCLSSSQPPPLAFVCAYQQSIPDCDSWRICTCFGVCLCLCQRRHTCRLEIALTRPPWAKMHLQCKQTAIRGQPVDASAARTPSNWFSLRGHVFFRGRRDGTCWENRRGHSGCDGEPFV